ncbi:MAG: S-layer homology domain-containing protein, partial [Clostridia bacterium]|nr:S-layer homology domain-containing protein [Clostridia bacterium]
MKRTVCFIMALALAFTMLISSAYAKTVTDTLFEQNFDSNLNGVTQEAFKTIERPADGSDTYTAYTPNGSKDGAFISDITSTSVSHLRFGEKFTGKFAFEADFRLEGKAYTGSSGQVKFFDAYSSTGKNIFMITSGNCLDGGYGFRPVYTKEDGSLHVGHAGADLEYKKWYHLKVEITTDDDADMGTMAFYIDGEKRCEGYSRAGKALGNLNDLATIKFYQAAGGAFPFIIDNIKVYENPNVEDKTKDATVKSTVYSVGDDTISGVPSGTTVADFKAAISARKGAKLEVYSDYDKKTLREGAVENGDTLEVTAPDGVTKKLYGIMIVNISTEYFVAPDGSESGNGSEKAPFASLEQAKAAVRAAKALGKPITVYFKAGTYKIDKQTAFTAEDSGTAEAPITYKAYGDGKVQFKGSVSIPGSAAKKVTDKNILDRVISDFAKDRLMQIDLKAYGVKDIPAIPDVYGYAYGGWSPIEIYINGTALSEARWPNGNTYLRVTDTNGKLQNFTMKYNDDTNRAANWTKSIADKEVCVQGSPGHPYAVQHLKLVDIDTENRVVTGLSTNYVPNTTNGKFYFTNLVEEIDLPGESWIDRKNGVVYFYPACDMASAEVEVSEFNSTAITMNGTEYVNFEDLSFGYTRANFIKASKVSNITIDGCEFAHNSSTAIELDGTDCVIKNCHIYDLGGAAGKGAITLSGGDRVKLISSGNKILNNRMHLGDRVYQVGQAPLIMITGGVGHTIENNEIYNGSAYVARFVAANDIQFNYNEVYDAVLQSSDAGAVTWGRDMSLMGFELKYNYFHNMGNPHGGVGQQSVFADDAATGPYMFGNIFYKGTLNESEAPKVGTQYSAYKTNGGGYGVFRNNIFVDSIGAAYFQAWQLEASSKEENKFRWWKQANDIYTGSTMSYWTNIEKYVLSDAWQQKYKGTQWENVSSRFSLDSHAKAKALKAEGKEAELNSFIKSISPDNPPNEFSDNVVINITLPRDTQKGSNDNGKDKNIYRSETDKLSGGASMFKNYGKDFALTAEGLAEVRKSAPGFENIPTDKIGIQPYERNGKTLYVGTREPFASDVMLSGSTVSGGTLRAAYKFQDPDGDREGGTDIRWFYSAKKNGTYEELSDARGSEMLVTDDIAGGYIYCTVTPYDINQVAGEAVQSEVLQLAKPGDVNKDALRTAIADAKQFLASAEIGSGEGQYPSHAKDALEAAIASAEETLNSESANQTAVNVAAKEMTAALSKFKLSKVEAANTVGITLNAALADSGNWYFDSDKSTISNSEAVIKPDFGSYKGKTYKDETISFRMKVSEDTEWAGIYLRQKNAEAIPWGGNSGLLIVIKPDQIETQIRDGGAPVMNTYANNSFRFGETAEVEAGIYDISQNESKIVLYINGEQVLSETRTDCPLAGKEGYFGIYASGGDVTIMPAEVDFKNLDAAIAETESFVSAAKAGTGYGEYDETALSELKAELSSAKEIRANAASSRSAADRAALTLEVKLDAAENTIGRVKEDFTASETVPVIYGFGKLTFNYPSGITAGIGVESGKMLPEIEGISPDARLYIEEETKASGSEFILPYKSTGADMDFVIKTGGVTFDKPIRIVIPGAGKKNVSYLSGGKWVRLSARMVSDTIEAYNRTQSGGTARYADGDNLVIWTTNPTDIGVSSSASASENTGDIGGGDIGGGGTGGTGTVTKPSAGNGSNGFYSTETTNPNIDIPFTDMVNHWAAADVMAMNKAGIVSGVTATLFDPDRNITRAEFAAI